MPYGTVISLVQLHFTVICTATIKSVGANVFLSGILRVSRYMCALYNIVLMEELLQVYL